MSAQRLAILAVAVTWTALAGATQAERDRQIAVTGDAQGQAGTGRISPDARFISFADWVVTGSLAIFEIRTGATSIVNKFSNVTPWADGATGQSIWAPDGTQLAYAWHPEGGASPEFRLVERDTGKHRTLYVTRENGPAAPLDWSPDGRFITVAIGNAAGSGTVGATALVLISVSDGVAKTLQRFDGSMPAGAFFSADGRYIAYDASPARDSPRDVFVLDTVDGSETPLLPDASTDDRVLGWLPSGHVLFTTGSSDAVVNARVIRIVDGRPQGSAVMVRSDVGPLEPQGVARDGRVFVQKVLDVNDIYLAELDPATGRAIRQPTLVPGARPGVTRKEPAWSPDGTRLAYVRTVLGWPQTVAIQTMATNEVREYKVGIRNIDWPLWHPNGRAFIFDGTGSDHVQRTFTLDLQTGQVTALSDSIVAGLSPDGQYLYGETRRGQGLLRRSLLDGTTSVVVPLEDVKARGIGGILLSPDGNWLVSLTRGARRGAASLLLRSTSGGPVRVLTESFAAGYARFAWSRDSRYVIFNDNATGLNRIAINGGKPEPLGIRSDDFGMFREKSMNVDGRRLVFGATRGGRELWQWVDVCRRSC
jgi:Tol biopolymer transport system component